MDKNILPKLMQLIEIQEVDTCLDEIVKLRGTLPEEVEVLEKRIEKLSAKIAENTSLLTTLREEIVNKKAFIKDTEKKIQHYEARQMEVRNNREYDAIAKEIELYKLDIQLAEKFLRTAYTKVEQDHNDLEELHKLLKVQENDFFIKKQELESILKVSAAEERALHTKRVCIVTALGESLYMAYERIRQSVQNNLVVVSIKKGACGGCCIVIPPQQKLEVYERNKIVFCEHCGRMLVASEQSIDAFYSCVNT
ncbi:zinc ribbon domain-containing protein [Candidatus Cardinium hertigii]|jgi:predicted  nucleic acid-binding Zn-ribbon protein|uniref:C4-type zinc ribbon domain-containing protein n=1 Tax=Candidatus Cardinium hertigii TaxID=247481 RepID=A0A3N2QBS4_9BACT|nr:C4-type zinc ribbon domain-containing protein [Candidatus Cardinium hertigii]ROT47221.1 hypothetical protein EDM02_03630 [Candidatus Cardinium hertigii]